MTQDQPRDPSGRFVSMDSNTENTPDEAESDDRDDHRVDVPLSFDNAGAAHVAALRDAGVDVASILSRGLEVKAEELLFQANRQVKYGGGQQRGQGQRPPADASLSEGE